MVSSTDLEKTQGSHALSIDGSDEEELARMGYKQELKRDLGLIQVKEIIVIAMNGFLTDCIFPTRILASLSLSLALSRFVSNRQLICISVLMI